jgi:DNA polymerase-1
MEDRGTRVFPETVKELRAFYEEYKTTQVAVAEANGGVGLNYNSSVQMCKKFYDERGHKPSYTEAGNYSLNGEALLALSLTDPLAKAVLEYKAAEQTINTFLDTYARYWSEDEPGVFVLHPNYKQTGTVTGRLSCSDPNLMQVASETTGRRKADIQSRPREAFGPRPDCYWYLPDYSQIEVWIFAYLSGEKKMQDALLSGKDFHGTISGQVFGGRKDFKDSKSYYRKCAKLIMFAKLYGGGAGKISLLLKTPDGWRCTRCEYERDVQLGENLEIADVCPMCGADLEYFPKLERAKRFIERWEAELPGVPVFMKRMINRAQRDGIITNPFGRVYEFQRDFAYKSVNYLIQGTAADVMKNAIVAVDDVLRTRWEDGPKLLLTIHDELCVEVPRAYHSKRLMREIISAMQTDQHVLGLPVPLPVGIKIVKPGQRWHQTTEVPVS